MKKSNMNTFFKKMNKVEPKEIELQSEGLAGMKIQVTPILDFVSANSFVEEIVSTVIDMEEMVYQPELFDFIERVATLEYYAGFDIGSCTPENMYLLVYGTGLYEEIVNHIDHTQFYGLIGSANQKIEYIRNIQTSALSIKAEQILSAMSEMINTGNDAIKAIDTKEFKDAVMSLTSTAAAPAKQTRKRKKVADAEVKE